MAKTQLERNKKYMEKHQIKQVKFNFNADECALIETAAKKQGISKKELVIKCVRYYIDNDIKFED